MQLNCASDLTPRYKRVIFDKERFNLTLHCLLFKGVVWDVSVKTSAGNPACFIIYFLLCHASLTLRSTKPVCLCKGIIPNLVKTKKPVYYRLFQSPEAMEHSCNCWWLDRGTFQPGILLDCERDTTSLRQEVARNCQCWSNFWGRASHRLQVHMQCAGRVCGWRPWRIAYHFLQSLHPVHFFSIW